MEYLDHICNDSQRDATLLYACVLEAQRVGDRALSIISLQQVLRKYNYKAPSGVHLPALLRYGIRYTFDWSKLIRKTRCTIRLLTQSVEDGSASNLVSQEEICKLFEGGMSAPLDHSSRSNIVKVSNKQKCPGTIPIIPSMLEN